MNVIIDDAECIGGERETDLESAMTPQDMDALAQGFARLAVTLVEKGVLSLEECGRLNGHYYIREA